MLRSSTESECQRWGNADKILWLRITRKQQENLEKALKTRKSINVAEFKVTLQKNAQTRRLIKIFTKHNAKMIKRQHFKQLLRFIKKIVSP